MHSSMFDYLKPTDEQLDEMQAAREAVRACATTLKCVVPDGPDKTYLLRKLREVGMWANVAITRLPDGSPRAEPLPYPTDAPQPEQLELPLA